MICVKSVINSKNRKISYLINIKPDTKINSQSMWRSGKISHSAGFRSVDRTFEPRTLSDKTAVILVFRFIS